MGLGLIKNYRKWLFLGPLLLFIFDHYLIQNDIIRPLDMLIYQRLNSLESPVVTKAVIMITQLGSFIGIMGMILAEILIFHFAPVENENRMLELQEKMLFRKQAIQLLITVNVIISIIFPKSM